jgi:Asp-tRNA(Asn)/Glu-tRNA(Gln) amidotransferase A subunit family amidase
MMGALHRSTPMQVTAAFLTFAALSAPLLAQVVGAPPPPPAPEPEPATEDTPKLAVDDVRAAGRVIGLDFTDKELELMLPGVLEHLGEFERLRAPSLANSVLPAFTFSPFLPGMERHVAPRESYFTDGPVRAPSEALYDVELARPADLEELAFATLAQIHVQIRLRLVSCVELTEMYLRRLERLDRELHCVVTFTRERALAQAAALDAELAAGKCRGPLHGIPWGVKDLFAVEGYRTTWGAMPFKDQVIDETATVVQRLDDAGAILIAKLSVGALAMGDVWFEERTRSPWNPERGSSGSSAGSAAATAAGGVAFAIGTETLGSIISPSVVCATSALRPTFGRVSRHGAMALSWTMDKVGPIARTVDDAALVFAAIQGADPQDPYSRDRRPVAAARLAVLREADSMVTVDSCDSPSARRIGVIAGGFRRSDEVAPVVEELRALGHTIVEVTLPDFPVGEMLLLLSAEAATAFDELTRSGQDDLLVRQDKGAWPNLFRVARLIPAVEYLRAQRLRTQLMLALHAALADVDLIVHAPYAAGILQMTNLTGHPTVIAPYVGAAGPREDGSPRSVCFTGQLDGDEFLLAVVESWQRQHQAHVRRPPLAWLALPDERVAPAVEGGGK